MQLLKSLWLKFLCLKITTGYFGLRKIDNLLTNYRESIVSPYLQGLWDERQTFIEADKERRNKYGEEAYKYQSEEEYQRWMFINSESNKLFPQRYIDIRKVFTFLYHKTHEANLSREERFKYNKRVQDILKKIKWH